MKKYFILKEMGIGFLIATIATICGSYLFIEYFSPFDFYKTIELIKGGELVSKILVIGAISNLFVFFVFLRKKQLYRARGVLFQLFIVAFIVLYLTLFGN